MVKQEGVISPIKPNNTIPSAMTPAFQLQMQQKAKRTKIIVISIVIILLVVLILSIRKYPKATGIFGLIIALYLGAAYLKLIPAPKIGFTD